MYLVSVVMGDGQGYVRDNMGIFLEGEQVDSVTADGINYEERTYAVRVSDGQLTLKLDDLGGDPFVMINSLEVVTSPPDSEGPQIVAMEPAEALGTLDEIIVEFNETIDSTTFTPGDVVSLTGPGGNEIPVSSIEKLTGTRFVVQFAPQTELGTYNLTVGPEIRDLVGNRMDQDGDGQNAEVPDDQFTDSLTLAPQPPFEVFFDFGDSGSPVAEGSTEVLKNTSYSPETGFGWISGSVDSRDRGGSTGNDFERDFNFTGLATFAVDVPAESSYQVTLTMGDGLGYVRDEMGIFLEGTFVDSVTADGQNYAVETYTVTVTDGQLTLRLDDLGGDPFVMINALEILDLGPDTTGPQVAEVDPSGEIPEMLDRFVVTFNEAVNAETFTVDDVEIQGPNGSVAASSVNPINAGQFEVLFDPQTATGDYTLTVGPDIEDLVGNLMDQDGDGLGGETGDDTFQASVELVPRPPFEGLFDFGTSGSPVADGYTQVLKTTSYSAGTGFGWIDGSVSSRDRGSSAGNDLERDFNFTGFAAFAVDVPLAGDYEVTITLGDGLGYVRDQMGIFLEGEQVDSVTTDGVNFAVRTYTVAVTDGQLTLLLDDLGGDPWVMINGLEVHEAVEAAGLEATGTSSESTVSSESATGLDGFGLSLDRAIPPTVFREQPIDLLWNGNVSEEPKFRRSESQRADNPLENRPVLDQIFSTNLPRLFEALEGLGDLGLSSPISTIR